MGLHGGYGEVLRNSGELGRGFGWGGGGGSSWEFRCVPGKLLGILVGSGGGSVGSERALENWIRGDGFRWVPVVLPVGLYEWKIPPVHPTIKNISRTFEAEILKIFKNIHLQPKN